MTESVPAADGVAAALARARLFVVRRGGDLDRRFVDALAGACSGPELLDALGTHQEPGGAIGPWRREGSGDFATTVAALERLDAFALLDNPVVEAAVEWLGPQQREDGSFGEGDLPARIVRTGAVGGLLAKSPFARPAWLHAVDAFLCEHFTVERLQGGALGAIAAYSHWMGSWPSERSDEVLQWCGRELERGFRLGAFDALSTARVLLRARARGLPGARLDPSEIVLSLLGDQEADGAWPGEGEARLDATLDAMEALARLAAG